MALPVMEITYRAWDREGGLHTAGSDDDMIDYVQVGERVRVLRPTSGLPATWAEAVDRRHCYWAGLHAAGATYRQISIDSGFAVSTVESGVKRGRKILAREARRGRED